MRVIVRYGFMEDPDIPVRNTAARFGESFDDGDDLLSSRARR